MTASHPRLRLVGPDERVEPSRAPESFAVAFRQHYRLVHRMVREFGVEDALAEDVTQEVFMVVLRRWDDYDGTAAFRRWLLGIARRVAADHRRSKRRARARLTRFVPWHRAGDLDEGLAAREAVGVVELFLETLDEPRRLVFVLSDIEGLSAPEISEILGVKLNTVYSRLRAARQRFASFLARQRARERSERGELHG